MTLQLTILIITSAPLILFGLWSVYVLRCQKRLAQHPLGIRIRAATRLPLKLRLFHVMSRVRGLKKAGFEELGIKEERLGRFFVIYSRVFYSKEHQVYASVFVVMGFWVVVTFSSEAPTGDMVNTGQSPRAAVRYGLLRDVGIHGSWFKRFHAHLQLWEAVQRTARGPIIVREAVGTLEHRIALSRRYYLQRYSSLGEGFVTGESSLPQVVDLFRAHVLDKSISRSYLRYWLRKQGLEISIADAERTLMSAGVWAPTPGFFDWAQEYSDELYDYRHTPQKTFSMRLYQRLTKLTLASVIFLFFMFGVTVACLAGSPRGIFFSAFQSIGLGLGLFPLIWPRLRDMWRTNRIELVGNRLQSFVGRDLRVELNASDIVYVEAVRSSPHSFFGKSFFVVIAKTQDGTTHTLSDVYLEETARAACEPLERALRLSFPAETEAPTIKVSKKSLAVMLR